MSQSLAQIYLHLVFSTKDRFPFLKDPNFRSRVHAYMVGICKNRNCPSLQIGGVEDHVHILCRFGKGIELQNLMRDLKRDSSLWVKAEMPSLSDFHWQAGYGAFSVSPAHVDALVYYIANQEEHHRQVSFQEEFRRICRKYGVQLDERYAWD
jgi:putative transposase